MGIQGVKGDKGDPGTSVPSGTVIFLFSATPAPAGYTLIGSFSQTVDSTGGGKKQTMQFNIYQKN